MKQKQFQHSRNGWTASCYIVNYPPWYRVLKRRKMRRPVKKMMRNWARKANWRVDYD